MRVMLDYAADSKAVDTYISTCTAIGGQNIIIDVDYSASDPPSFLNLKHILGVLCDQDDIRTMGLL